MKWFKHMSNASDDIFIRELEERFGNTGYAWWFKTLELIAAQGDDGTLEIPLTQWRRTIDSGRTDHLRRLYALATERGRLVYEMSNKKMARITIPKFVEYADEYTKKTKRTPDTIRTHSGQCPLPLDKKEIRLEQKKKEIGDAPRPPSEDDVKNYMAEIGVVDFAGEALKFWNYYESKGWRVGKSPMKKWRAAARGWVLRGKVSRDTREKCHHCGERVQNVGWHVDNNCEEAPKADPKRAAQIINSLKLGGQS